MLNAKFATYSTRIAFNLNLTRVQIQYIELLRHYINGKTWEEMHNMETEIRGPHGIHNPHIFVPTVRKLCDMGLVEHNPKINNGSKGKIDWYYRFTEAGECVCKLLEMAALISTIKNSKKAA